MTYRVVTRIEVINELGEVVDHKGNVGNPKRQWFPLSVTQVMATADDPTKAREHLNKLFALNETIRTL